MAQVFLSHSKKDAKFSQRITDDLRAAGISVWKAPESIRPGENWVDALERGLLTSTHLVLLMSPAAAESWWVNWEFNTAMALHAREQIEILPLDYLPCNLPLRWQSFQALSGIRDDYDATISKLINQIQITPPEQPQAFRRNLQAEYLYQIKLTISTPTKHPGEEQSNQLSILEDYARLERIYQLQPIIFFGDPRFSRNKYPPLRIGYGDILLDDNRDYGFSSARKALESTLSSDEFTTIDELLGKLTSTREPIPVGCDLSPTWPRKRNLQRLDCADRRESSEGVFDHEGGSGVIET